MPTISPHLTEEAKRGAMSSPAPLSTRRGARPVLPLALPVVGLAVWYGFLDSNRERPLLKLTLPMTIAGVGVTALALSRRAGVHDRTAQRSALIELHPLTLTVAWLSVGASLIHFAVVPPQLRDYKL